MKESKAGCSAHVGRTVWRTEVPRGFRITNFCISLELEEWFYVGMIETGEDAYTGHWRESMHAIKFSSSQSAGFGANTPWKCMWVRRYTTLSI